MRAANAELLVDTRVLGTRVDPTTYAEATKRVIDWASNRESRYVCIANVHVVMEGYDSPAFREQVNAADLVTPDGMPLVWALRRTVNPRQTRVYGPDLMKSVIQAATKKNVAVGLLGGKPDVLDELEKRLLAQFPGIDIRYRFSPPFRPITPQEDNQIVDDINRSGAKILFVGLGCPRQEMWMAEHAGRVRAVMLGVGAAFDFHAGAIKQAPGWMQNLGLEWVFRLSREPKRLWRRYLYHNPRFVVAQWLGTSRKSGSERDL
jgi:N-acetylglucosaminyldiphosphoundecaprenol N-acetyl-beta-D-mannosaminyltransferase